jgi:tetratricopeptide (TPR) repeat protein
MTALQINPDFAEAHFNIGITLVAKHRYAEAIEHFSAALAQHLKLNQNQDTHNKNGLSKYFKQGNVYENTEKIDEAIEQYTRALSVPAEYLSALMKLAALYSAKNDYPKALSLYQIDPSPAGLRQALLRGYQNWNPVQSSFNKLKRF